jgi:CheY-like chemotaxis protein
VCEILAFVDLSPKVFLLIGEKCMNSYISILIADDDQDDAAFLNEGLSKIIKSYRVSNAVDGVECMSFLKTNPAPELIFLDLNMPLRSGIECLKLIRGNPLLDQTWVIMFSTSCNYRDIDTCYKLGANFYIVKPVLFKTMVKVLGKLFKALGKPKSELLSKDQFVLMEHKTSTKDWLDGL